MKIKALGIEDVPAFRDYFKKYSFEQDESFPPTVDYIPRIDEPAILLIDDNADIAGAAVLMLHKEYKEAKTGRFRMFHCIRKEAELYRVLQNEILKYTKGLNDIYCFVEDFRTDTKDVWEKLGFKIKRYSFALKRDVLNFTPPEFPEGFTLKTFRHGIDEQAWCDIINESFANMQGHVHLYPSKIDEWKNDPSFLAEGMKMLWHGNEPIGTMAVMKENENGEDVAFIEAVGILNSYQGRGLGKNLIRAGLEFSMDSGFNNVMLSVNAENERAADLYVREGFKKEALIICYHLKFN
ncbi:MAG TPA: GNAT family N-acetyltransferase [Ignavibacteria bacterium]|nr:GNAT family N-acetyltransferase [Ignavibacteria bacterium]